MLDHNTLYVCHMGSSVVFCGTKDECIAHKDAQPYRTDSWQINNLEDYGQSCYDDGYDNGYDCGFHTP